MFYWVLKAVGNQSRDTELRTIARKILRAPGLVKLVLATNRVPVGAGGEGYATLCKFTGSKCLDQLN